MAQRVTEAERAAQRRLVGVVRTARALGSGGLVDAVLADFVGLLNDALQRRAQAHRLVDVLADEESRHHASVTEGRAARARSVAEGPSAQCGDPHPAPTTWARRADRR